MHRRPLLEALEHYRAVNPGERATVERFVEFVRANARCFERSLEEGHVTGSAWLLDGSMQRVLLTHHRKLDIWVQLGGHADGVPDVLGVALREAQEESGLTGLRPLSRDIFDIDIHRIPARPDEPEHLHYDVRFALLAAPGQEVKVSEESHELRWVDVSGLGALTREQSMLRMARKWLEVGAGR